MPLITRLFIRSGMLFFVASLILAVLQQLNLMGGPALAPLFWHMLMLGWITQIIMGVSLWMFPGRSKQEDFKSKPWPWLAYVFLNTGLILRVISEPFINQSGAYVWQVLLSLSAILQLAGVGAYVMEIWPRVISKKAYIRKRKEGKL